MKMSLLPSHFGVTFTIRFNCKIHIDVLSHVHQTGAHSYEHYSVELLVI